LPGNTVWEVFSESIVRCCLLVGIGEVRYEERTGK
jgi:hypothetical protein